nr:uncharacterized protein LOC123766657 [Procambarus clarkii]
MDLRPPGDQDQVLARLRGPLAADDPRVLDILRRHYLTPPSTRPYNLSTDPLYIKLKHYGSWKSIYKQIKQLFGAQRGGFFIEAGALDGERLSNTLWLERYLGWTGLLVEPSPVNYRILQTKQRKAWTSHTCLSVEPFPKREIMVTLGRKARTESSVESMMYAPHGSSFLRGVTLDSHIYDNLLQLSEKSYSVVQCFPLLSYLLALNVSEVDLLSLDVQGAEKAVLRHVPWQTLRIRVLVVEVVHRESFDHDFADYMKSVNYTLVHFEGEDYTFVRNDDPALRNVDVVGIYV